MIIGVTGHQDRESIDWTWLQTELLALLSELRPSSVLSALAAGTDQMFAAVALQLGCRLVSVLPFEGYEDLFEGDSRRMFRFLREASDVERLSLNMPDEQAFLEASRYIVDHCDVLVAVWDGEPAEGLGGTADVVSYARSRARQMFWIEPRTRKIRREGQPT